MKSDTKPAEGHTIKVLEVGQLDTLPHAQDVGGTANAVEHHPHIASVQSGDFCGSFGLGMPIVLQRMLDIGPGCDYGAENHQPEREQGHSAHRPSEPQDFPVCDKDDGQILKDGIDRNREELKRFRAGVNRANE